MNTTSTRSRGLLALRLPGNGPRLLRMRLDLGLLIELVGILHGVERFRDTPHLRRHPDRRRRAATARRSSPTSRRQAPRSAPPRKYRSSPEPTCSASNPCKAYPEEYQRTTEIARDELNQNARTQVKGKVDDMAQYDTIFVGYPIWWMEPPMPVLTFLESYDLNGKTVIPFATSASSGIDGTLDMLRSSAKGANVTEGLRVTSNDEIQPWLQKIGVLK